MDVVTSLPEAVRERVMRAVELENEMVLRVGRCVARFVLSRTVLGREVAVVSVVKLDETAAELPLMLSFGPTRPSGVGDRGIIIAHKGFVLSSLRTKVTEIRSAATMYAVTVGEIFAGQTPLGIFLAAGVAALRGPLSQGDAADVCATVVYRLERLLKSQSRRALHIAEWGWEHTSP